MKSLVGCISVVIIMFTGCAGSFQGIKMRAQSPSIDEAYRKISLAVSMDGYKVKTVDPAMFRLETEWRPLKQKEKSDQDLISVRDSVEAKIAFHIDRRGALYDVFLSPMLRYAGTREIVPDVKHPLREKWEKVLRTVLQQEFKEED